MTRHVSWSYKRFLRTKTLQHLREENVLWMDFSKASDRNRVLGNWSRSYHCDGKPPVVVGRRIERGFALVFDDEGHFLGQTLILLTMKFQGEKGMDEQRWRRWRRRRRQHRRLGRRCSREQQLSCHLEDLWISSSTTTTTITITT